MQAKLIVGAQKQNLFLPAPQPHTHTRRHRHTTHTETHLHRCHSHRYSTRPQPSRNESSHTRCLFQLPSRAEGLSSEGVPGLPRAPGLGKRR